MNREHYIELPVRKKWWIFSYWSKQAFEFNMAAWFTVYEQYDWDIEAIRALPKEELSARMIYEAAKQGNFVNGKPFKTPLGKLLSWVGNMRKDDGDKLGVVFTKSAYLMAESMSKMAAKETSKKK